VTRAEPATPRVRPVALALEHPERQLFGRTALEDVGALLWVAGTGAGERARLARRALGEVGLDPDRFGERAPLTLSEGEKRRVALAGLLVTPPLVVLLDEPTAGLDPEGRRALVAAVRALRERGRAVLLASHDLDFVGAVADRAVLLARDGEAPGRVAASGPAGALLRDEATLARAGLPPPDFVLLADALLGSGLLSGPAPRDGESLLAALARRLPGGRRLRADRLAHSGEPGRVGVVLRFLRAPPPGPGTGPRRGTRRAARPRPRPPRASTRRAARSFARRGDHRARGARDTRCRPC
jgi:energy-coupling factor transporter ATP-binding protein EcfA2